MTKILCRPVRLCDVAHLAHNLSADDRRELEASVGEDPVDAILASVQCSYDTVALHWDGASQVIAGCALHPDFKMIGVPWLLGTEALAKAGPQFLRLSKEFIQRWQSNHRILVNYVDVRHVRAQRWLEWLGFVKARLIESYGVGEKPFYEYTRHV